MILLWRAKLSKEESDNREDHAHNYAKKAIKWIKIAR